MKIRNKKTGEIGEPRVAYQEIYVDTTERKTYCYKSIAKFNEEWEDYKPAEPLIKEEKARKVFREWADLFGAKRFLVNHFCDSRRETTSIGGTDSATEPVIELPGHIGEDSKIYTRVELGGEINVKEEERE